MRTPFDIMYERYKLRPNLVIGKSLVTKQLPVSATRSLIIPATSEKFYGLLSVNEAVNIYIGARGVTITSGFVMPVGQIVICAVAENAEVYAVSESDAILYFMDLGL